MRRRFESDRRTPVRFILKELAEAREEKLCIYLIARLVGTLRDRGATDVSLSLKEERRLWQAFKQARFGKKPLGTGLPRGYQIARLAMTIKVLYPDASVSFTERDKRFVRLAFRYYDRIIASWSLRQIRSLKETLKHLGESV